MDVVKDLQQILIEKLYKYKSGMDYQNRYMQCDKIAIYTEVSNGSKNDDGIGR